MYFTDAPTFGGAEQVLDGLMRSLPTERWRAVLVNEGRSELAPLVNAAAQTGARVHILGRGDPSGRVARALALARAVRLERPDVFHANLTWPLDARYAPMVARVLGVPAVIASLHSFGVHISQPAARVQRILSVAVHRYIAVSEFVAARLRDRIGISDRKIRVVSNGIASERFGIHADPKRKAELFGVDPSTPVVFTAARLDAAKGHEYLIAAAAEVPNVVFAIAGDGSLRQMLERAVVRLGLAQRVLFLGQRTDIPDLLANCDVVVVPSLVEAFGLSVIEAMAAERPVVATCAGALPELVEHERTGLLVPPANAQALAQAIERMLRDRSLSQRLVSTARERVVPRYTTRRMVDGVLSVYEEVLDGGSCRT